MHRFGWLLILFGVLMVLGRGFFFLPLLFVPFLLWPLLAMLFFRGAAFGPGACGRGPRRYNWRGRQGYYYDAPRGPHARHGYHGHRRGPEGGEREGEGGERGYTGETTRL